MSAETCALFSRIRKGKVPVEATAAAAPVNKGKRRSQEFKDNLSKKLTGRPKSEGHKQAIKETHWSKREDAAEIAEKSASKNRGKKHTEEHKEAIAEGVKANHWTKRGDAAEIVERFTKSKRENKLKRQQAQAELSALLEAHKPPPKRVTFGTKV